MLQVAVTPGVSGVLTHIFRSERISAVRGHQTVSVENGSRPTAGDPDSTEDHADQDGQEGELGARVPASLCPSGERRFAKLVVDMGDIDVGAGDQGVRLGYVCGGTGFVEVRTMMAGFEAAGKSTILCRLKFSEMETTIATTGVNVETVEYKNNNVTVCAALCGIGSPLSSFFDRDRVDEGKSRAQQKDERGRHARCGCARSCQHTHTLHCNSFEKDNDRRAQDWGSLVVVCSWYRRRQCRRRRAKSTPQV